MALVQKLFVDVLLNQRTNEILDLAFLMVFELIVIDLLLALNLLDLLGH